MHALMPAASRELAGLTAASRRTYVRFMTSGTRLTEERLESIERNALMDRVIIELVTEVRLLRQTIASLEEAP